MSRKANHVCGNEKPILHSTSDPPMILFLGYNERVPTFTSTLVFVFCLTEWPLLTSYAPLGYTYHWRVLLQALLSLLNQLSRHYHMLPIVPSYTYTINPPTMLGYDPRPPLYVGNVPRPIARLIYSTYYHISIVHISRVSTMCLHL